MQAAKSLQGPLCQSAARTGKRERVFELSLPASIKGLEASGRRFEERTSICAISAQEVSFQLRSRLLVGSKVVIALDVPRTIILENPLRMVLSGTVFYIRSEAGSNGQSQFVSVRLDRSFRLLPLLYPPS